MGGVQCWEVRIHLWSTPLSPHSHPLKITVPLVCDRGPHPPPAPAAALERQHRLLHLISTKAHYIFNFCFEFPPIQLVWPAKRFKKVVRSMLSSCLQSSSCQISTSRSCSCVFSVHFLGLFFHSLIYAWGQLKLREHFGAAQGACVSGGMRRRPPHHKVEEIGNNVHLMHL